MIEPDQNYERRREILVVSHYFDAHGGGIERVVRRLVDELMAGGEFQFTWAASGIEPADDRSTADNANDDEDGKRSELTSVKLLPMKSYNWLERICGVPWPVWGWKSLRQLKEAIRRADLVWLHDAPYMGNIMAFRMARRMKKPVVITQHIGTIPYRNPLLRWLMLLGDKFFTQRMLRDAQQTIFISDCIAEHYHKKSIFKTPVMIVPNGVDPAVFHPVSVEHRQKLRDGFALRDDQPVLLFVGRFIEKKGLPVLERLTELLPEWRFWIAGRGPIDPERWYRPNVHVFHGRNGPALATLYQAADLLVLPSFGEGFPLVVQEAMACGLPVICSAATAAGSMLAKPFLLTATVDPASPARTAEIWAKRLKTQREFLPLAHLNEDLANAAHYFWSWPQIAGCYAKIFGALCARRAA